MKSAMLIVVLVLLSACSASPRIRIGDDGVNLSVVICPETGECFVIEASLVPDGWELVGDSFADPSQGFQAR